jgi:hypothetical protein
MIGQSLTENEDLVTYHYVDKLSPNIRVMLVPNNAPLILPLDQLGALDALTSTVPLTATTPLTTTQAMELLGGVGP